MGQAADQSDESLIARVADRDEAAMRTLYERHETAMYRFVRTRLRDPVEAADAVHDAMLDVWRQAGRFEGRSTVLSWMLSIARNKAIDRLRRAGRTVLSEPDEDVPDDAPDPLAAAMAAEDARRVRACVEELSAPHRAAVHLAFFADRSYPEIAEIEEVPLGTVKTRVHHAKRLLAACLTRCAARP